MADPVTLIGGGAIAAYLGKDGLQKLLGPTAEYLGLGLKDFTEKRINAVGRIFENATQKVGENIEKKQSVPPKVLRNILNEGSFASDDLAIEYFGGVLASSRSEIDRDDRGARLVKQIDMLSAYQLRFHYLLYSSISLLFKDKSMTFSPDNRRKMRLAIPIDGFVSAMEFSSAELDIVNTLIRHTLFGASSENLIESRMSYGLPLEYRKSGEVVQGQAISVQPSNQGAELFLWAHGSGNRSAEYMFNDSIIQKLDDDVIQKAGAGMFIRELGSSVGPV